MKGLLIKDLKLMLAQKRFFLLVFGMGIMLMFVNGEPSTAMGYIILLATTFSLNTVSYDEHEQGMSFLMTLPISRKLYVTEKYVFAGALAIIATVTAILLAYMATITRDVEQGLTEICVIAVIMLVIALTILAFTLPLKLKFGAEKGQMALFAVSALIGIVIALSFSLAEKMGSDFELAIDKILSQSIEKIVLLAVFALILVLLASYFISVRIINKKEY